MTSYMISLRSPSNGAALGKPRYLELDDAGAPSDVSMTAWRKAVLASFPTNQNGKPTGDLLFFVHGFNVSFDHARQAHMLYMQKLAKNGWPGLLVSYDWPSYGNVLDYYNDRSLARQSANFLIDTALALFVAALDPDCDVTVSVMAHSMGAFVTRRALSSAYQDTKTNSKAWGFSQLIFVAGDVSEGSLSPAQDGKWLSKYAGRTSNYSNRFDGVLQVSDIKNGDPTPRAGRVGLPDDAPASFCNVDTSDFYSGLRLSLGAAFNPATPHTYYFDHDEFWQDVVLTIGGGIDRNVIPTRSADPTTTLPNRFALKTSLIDAPQYQAALKHALQG